MDELNRLAADLVKASWKTVPAVEAVVFKGAKNIKDRMVEDAQRELGDGHLKHLHRAIDFDMQHGFGVIGAEIGPNPAKKQGELAHIPYFGTSKNAPILDVEVGLREEAPRFEQHLADAVEKSLAPMAWSLGL